MNGYLACNAILWQILLNSQMYFTWSTKVLLFLSYIECLSPYLLINSLINPFTPASANFKPLPRSILAATDTDMYMIVRWRRHNGDGGDCILSVRSQYLCKQLCSTAILTAIQCVCRPAKPKIGNVPSHPATICAIFIRSGQWAFGESVCGGSLWPSNCLPEFYIQLWVLFMLQPLD